MRLIDADDVVDSLKNWFIMHRYYHPYSKSNLIPTTEVIDIIDRSPTIEERKTGKWEVTGERKFVALDGSAEKQYRELGYPHHNVLNMRCSNCNKTTMVDASIAYGYCPHCGAKMGEAEEDE